MRFATLSVVLLLATVLLVGCRDKAETVPLDKVPDNVMQVAKKELPDVTFDQAWKTRSGNYEVRGKEKNGKTRDIQITPDGKVVEKD
jgi:hypothetical protein